MEPVSKKRKIFHPPPRRAAPSPTEKKDPAVSTATIKSAVNVAQTGAVVDLRIQQAKNHAIAQAQQDGSKANFRIFDSPYGNFLVPVVPTRAELDYTPDLKVLRRFHTGYNVVALYSVLGYNHARIPLLAPATCIIET